MIPAFQLVYLGREVHRYISWKTEEIPSSRSDTGACISASLHRTGQDDLGIPSIVAEVERISKDSLKR